MVGGLEAAIEQLSGRARVLAVRRLVVQGKLNGAYVTEASEAFLVDESVENRVRQAIGLEALFGDPERAIRIAVQHNQFYGAGAVAEAKLKDLERALDFYQQAEGRKRDVIRVTCALGDREFVAENFAQAYEYFISIDHHHKAGDVAMQGGLYVNATLAYLNARNSDKALHAFKQIQDIEARVRVIEKVNEIRSVCISNYQRPIVQEAQKQLEGQTELREGTPLHQLADNIISFYELKDPDTAIDIALQIGDRDRAYQVCETYKEDRRKISNNHSEIRRITDKGVALALEVGNFERAAEFLIDVSRHNEAGDLLLETNPSRALELYQTPRQKDFDRIAKAQAKTGDLDCALSTCDNHRRYGTKAEILTDAGRLGEVFGIRLLYVGLEDAYTFFQTLTRQRDKLSALEFMARNIEEYPEVRMGSDNLPFAQAALGIATKSKAQKTKKTAGGLAARLLFGSDEFERAITTAWEHGHKELAINYCERTQKYEQGGDYAAQMRDTETATRLYNRELDDLLSEHKFGAPEALEATDALRVAEKIGTDAVIRVYRRRAWVLEHKVSNLTGYDDLVRVARERLEPDAVLNLLEEVFTTPKVAYDFAKEHDLPEKDGLFDRVVEHYLTKHLVNLDQAIAFALEEKGLNEADRIFRDRIFPSFNLPDSYLEGGAKDNRPVSANVEGPNIKYLIQSGNINAALLLGYHDIASHLYESTDLFVHAAQQAEQSHQPDTQRIQSLYAQAATKAANNGDFHNAAIHASRARNTELATAYQTIARELPQKAE